jgi:hypothetical protein
MATIQLLFSVQGTGSSLTGPDPEVRWVFHQKPCHKPFKDRISSEKERANKPFKDKALTALFKEPVRTAL